MNTNLFFGGAQSPLSRSYLRAASILGFRDIQNPSVFATFNDIDSPGLREGTKLNSFITGKKMLLPIESKSEWNTKATKSEWLPISWKFPFQPKSQSTKYLVNNGY